MLTKPDALVTKIFKARYFKYGDFLTANLGSNPSFIWRSIIAAQNLVKKGVRRGIGNGESVFIYKDLWLPSEIDPMIKPGVMGLQEEKVSSLFLLGEKAWDVEIVRDLFLPEEVRCIPTRDQLRIKRVPVPSICPVCHVGDESIDLFVILSFFTGLLEDSRPEIWSRFFRFW